MPGTISKEQRRQVEAALVERAQRFDPAQLRRVARRGFETVEPDQRVVDAHENELVKSEEEADRERCAFTLSDNADRRHLHRPLHHRRITWFRDPRCARSSTPGFRRPNR